MTRALSIALVAAVLMVPAATSSAQGPDGPLTYHTTDLVTGDVVVGGTSLYRRGVNGIATRDITISGVPAGAEILSAYLYIQTTSRESLGEDAAIAGATFKGHSLNSAAGPIAKALNWAAGTQACWSYGWSPRRRLITYRADVLRFLEIDPASGKHIANGPHRVQVADSGQGSFFSDDEDDRPSMTGPRAVGASLVLIYRHPNPAAPLRAIVIYDGGVTKQPYDTMTQRIRGFYQPTANPDARMTHIVGDGQVFFSERVQFGASTYTANPFVGASGPRWDNPTFSLSASALKPYPDAANQNTVTVKSNGLFSDCLSWSAIVVSTKVQDTDNDGLLDIWESSQNPVLDPTGQPLPNLQQMGADPLHKDLFVEIGYLKADTNLVYGGGPLARLKPAHSHLPALEALKLVAEAFKDAPVANPDSVNGVNVHFDVGANYQTDPSDPLNPTSVPAYILPASLALGGRNILETKACTNTTGQVVVCPPGQMPGQYPLYPGTVGWKTGFRFYRDEILGFASNRIGIFRYALFAHALGLPRAEKEFLADGTPDFNFHVPRTNSGVADWAGGDLLITLGAFDDAAGKPVGTPFMQASTLMHEWGHNFGRRHGGDLLEPNCKPQYLSVMNYLYQLRGLPDEFGVPRLDYSAGQPAIALSELGLADGAVGSLQYRMGWYAPQATSYLKNLVGGAATKHCDGTPLLTTVPAEIPMVRVDATSVDGPVDWNADGILNSGPQDITFDGTITNLKPGANDWAKLRLNQLGSRRSVGGLFLDKLGRPTVGPLSLNAGKGDLGKGDLGKGDLGKGDLGKGDLGKGDLGKGDLGKGDLGTSVVPVTLGKGDLGKGDLGGGDLDVGSGTPAERSVQELDYETATAATGGNPTPASGLQACLTSDGACAPASGDRPVRLTWLAPNLGRVARYMIYRFEFAALPFEAPASLPTVPIGTVWVSEVGPPETTFLDYSAPAGKYFAYFVITQYVDGPFSGISNFATVATPAQVLAFVAQPASSSVGQTMPPVTVAIQTTGGSLVNLTGVPITLSLGNNPGNATLSGTTTQVTVNGVATFSNLSVDTPGLGFTLLASAESLTGATSQPFDITANPLSIVTSAVTDGTQGAPYSQTLAAQGGVAPYSWSIQPVAGDTNPPQFVLPAGLMITSQTNGTGLISGTPTSVQVRSFRVVVTDAAGHTATQDLCIRVEQSPTGTLAATTGQFTPEQLAQALAGEGVQISNVTYTGASGAIGSFTGGFGATRLSSGLILSSGNVTNVNPPNNSDSAGTGNGLPGDADLQTLIPGSTLNDAAVLEFDFVVTNASATNVKFDYVFASEEYSEFVNSAYNDVFGFFISEGTSPKTNLALIPNTNTPVSINTVNGGWPLGTNATNPDQFISNPLGSVLLQADGLTKVFSIAAEITPLTKTYHLKIAIADATDFGYDSFVMLKAGSFSVVCPIIPGCNCQN